MEQRLWSFLSYNRGLAGNTYDGRMKDSEDYTSLPWSFPEHKGSYGRREPKISNYLFNDNEFNVITYLMIIFIKLNIVFKSTVKKMKNK